MLGRDGRETPPVKTISVPRRDLRAGASQACRCGSDAGWNDVRCAMACSCHGHMRDSSVRNVKLASSGSRSSDVVPHILGSAPGGCA